MKHIKNIFHIVGLFIFMILNPLIGILIGVLTIPYYILIHIFPGIKVFAKKALPEESVLEVQDVKPNVELDSKLDVRNDVHIISFSCNDYYYEIVVKFIDNQYCIYTQSILSAAKEYDESLRYTNADEATSKAYRLSKTLHREIDLELRSKLDGMCNEIPF